MYTYQDNVSLLIFKLQGPRAQIDRDLYKHHLQAHVFSTPNLTVKASSVEDLIIVRDHDGESCAGVVLGKLDPGIFVLAHFIY